MGTINKDDFGGWAISIELFDWICENLPFDSVILELGSGVGTIALLEHYKVHSIEDSKRWLGFAKGADYIYAPLRSYGTHVWYDADKLTNLPPYDLLLIDGPANREKRGGFLENRHLFNMDVRVIIDDTNWHEEMELAEKLSNLYNKKLTEYDGGKKNFIVLI